MDDEKKNPLGEYDTAEQWGEDYPNECDFFKIKKAEFYGWLPPHSVRMTLSLPYSDWCKFEESKVYRDLVEYLKEAEKQYIRRRKSEEIERSEHAVYKPHDR